MRIADMNWMQVQEHVKHDDRCVIPIGSTEQHAQLSLCVDAIIAERMAEDAAEPLGVPVFPVMSYGLSVSFADYPGTVVLRVTTMAAMVADVLDSVYRAGFRRIVINSAHNGNLPMRGVASEWQDTHRGAQVKWHYWCDSPRVVEVLNKIEPDANHASWLENFPWTRVPNLKSPEGRKSPVDLQKYFRSDPGEKKKLLGDGNYGGTYQRSDADAQALWNAGVEDAREAIANNWTE